MEKDNIPTVLVQDISETEKISQYDQEAKKLLANKEIRARIMQKCVDEFKSMEVDDILPCIEGEIQISEVPVGRGLTNRPKIVGAHDTDRAPFEGSVFYDIYFWATVPNERKTVRVYINLEMQNDYYPGYPLEKRAMYYVARLLSAQGGRDISLANREYDRLSKVYSIWICMNTPADVSDTIVSYSMEPHFEYGTIYLPKHNYDLMEVVMIGIGTKSTTDKNLPGLLYNLLSNKMAADEKKRVLEEIYDLKMTLEGLERMGHMTNLGEGIYNDGQEIGFKIGHQEGHLEGSFEKLAEIVRKKLSKGQTIEFIAEDLEEDIEVIKKIAETAACCGNE